MKQFAYAIQHKLTTLNTPGALFWNIGWGWNNYSGATIYSIDEKDTLNLPINGVWISVTFDNLQD